MATYFCVTSAWYDDGHGTADITDVVDADEKPQDSFKSTMRKDIYLDWYESYEDAQAVIEAVRKA